MEDKDIITLAIETSCDETAAAIVKNGVHVLSNRISSQIKLHELYGGVVPEIASRKHVEKINPIIEEALKEARISYEDIDFISVTYGPGLVGALLVGISAAKALAYSLSIPLVGVHHIEGHIAANYISNPDFKPPFLCLVVSGGHSHLVKVNDYREFEIIGQTRDDAIGEAYDKVARTIGLGYPGGPKIDAMFNEKEAIIDFPKSFINDDNYDFSFSGIKSAVLNYVNSKTMKNEEIDNVKIASSFQKSVVDVLVAKTIKAALDNGMDKIAIAGGVSANSYLRKRMKEEAEKYNIFVQVPEFKYCTDNAAMIGAAGYNNYMNGKIDGLDLNANPNLKLGE